ncbi:MAG: hypothetical protein DRP62_03665 [Planctomycetota bacterium]|nr:MAG: hypothetical protein DRP62_03665 [Planctomycetota bacterium]
MLLDTCFRRYDKSFRRFNPPKITCYEVVVNERKSSIKSCSRQAFGIFIIGEGGFGPLSKQSYVTLVENSPEMSGFWLVAKIMKLWFFERGGVLCVENCFF